MVERREILQLKYSRDLISAGIEFEINQLGNLQSEQGATPSFDLLRERIAEKAVELAFRRHISKQNLPHHLIQSKSFNHNDQHYIQMGGRRCRIFNLLITHRKTTDQIKANPSQILRGYSLVPAGDAAQHNSQDDIYIFTSMTGSVTRNLSDLKKSLAEGHATNLFFHFPQAWARPTDWKPLGPLALKGDTLETHHLNLSGKNKMRQNLKTQLALPQKEKIITQEDYYSLHYLQIDKLPVGAIGIHSPRLHDTLLIAPYQWGNLWVEGSTIFLLGFLSQKEFFQQAKMLCKGNGIMGNPSISEDSYSLPIEKLRPISELFRRARDWENR